MSDTATATPSKYKGRAGAGNLFMFKTFSLKCMKITADSISSRLTTCFLLISEQTLWKQPPPCRADQRRRAAISTPPSHLGPERSPALKEWMKEWINEWMDRLNKNIAAMLDTQQHSNSIIISPVITHTHTHTDVNTGAFGCSIWLVSTMMEVVVWIPPVRKSAFGEKGVLLSSRVIIYLSKQEASHSVAGSLPL